MPGFNGTGPTGRGPMTGGGRGYCVLKLPGSVAVPNYPYGYAGVGTIHKRATDLSPYGGRAGRSLLNTPYPRRGLGLRRGRGRHFSG